MYTASCSNLLAQKFSWIATLLVFMAPELHCLVSKGSETLKPNIAHYWFLKNPDIISSKGNSTLVGFRSSPARPGVQTRGTPGKATEQAGCGWRDPRNAPPSAGVPWWSWRNWWEMNMDVHPKWSKAIKSLHLWSILPCLSRHFSRDFSQLPQAPWWSWSRWTTTAEWGVIRLDQWERSGIFHGKIIEISGDFMLISWEKSLLGRFSMASSSTRNAFLACRTLGKTMNSSSKMVIQTWQTWMTGYLFLHFQLSCPPLSCLKIWPWIGNVVHLEEKTGHWIQTPSQLLP